MGGDCSQKLLLRRGMHSSPGRSRSSDHYSISKIRCRGLSAQGVLFFPHQGRLCAFRRSVNIVSFETSLAGLMSSQRYSALAAWSPLPRQNGSLPHRR